MAVLHLMVGPTGSGKSTRAASIDGVLLSPDPWMIALFGESDAGGKRDILEGRLIAVALETLRRGTDVILDFGLLGRDERTALRWLARAVGGFARVDFEPTDAAELRRRVRERWAAAPHTTFPMDDAFVDRQLLVFEVPTPDERTGALDPVPAGFADWAAWASWRWPTLPRFP
jgi:predicted kinase